MTPLAVSEKSYVQTSEVPIPPEIRTDGVHLFWSLRQYKKIKTVRPSRAMLDQFLKLADGSAEAICRFASKFGILGICAEHGQPTSHNLVCELAPGPVGWWAEPLDRWRLYAGQFQAILRLADELNRERLGRKEDWALLDPTQDPIFEKATHRTGSRVGAAGARNRLAGIVNDFIEVGVID